MFALVLEPTVFDRNQGGSEDYNFSRLSSGVAHEKNHRNFQFLNQSRFLKKLGFFIIVVFYHILIYDLSSIYYRKAYG